MTHPLDLPDWLRRDANNRAPWMDPSLLVKIVHDPALDTGGMSPNVVWAAAQPAKMVISPEAFDRFVSVTDNPPEPNEALKELMRHKMPWET